MTARVVKRRPNLGRLDGAQQAGAVVALDDLDVFMTGAPGHRDPRGSAPRPSVRLRVEPGTRA